MRLTVVVLTVPIVALLTQPLWAPEWGAGILGELRIFGPVGAACAVVVFLGLVALYCRSLQRLVTRVPADRRAQPARAVWGMFAVPFNFVADFYIVRDVARTLRADGRIPAQPLRFWLVTGQLWCVLQIAALLPGPVGMVSGVFAITAWAVHWSHSALIGRRLKTDDRARV